MQVRDRFHCRLKTVPGPVFPKICTARQPRQQFPLATILLDRSVATLGRHRSWNELEPAIARDLQQTMRLR
jgi:hypothetical protein